MTDKTEAEKNAEFKQKYGYARDKETNAQKFNRLFSKRVENAVEKINLIGNCAGVGYEYDVETVGRVMDYLRDKIDTLQDQFTETEAEDTESLKSEIENAMLGETEETPSD